MHRFPVFRASKSADTRRKEFCGAFSADKDIKIEGVCFKRLESYHLPQSPRSPPRYVYFLCFQGAICIQMTFINSIIPSRIKYGLFFFNKKRLTVFSRIIWLEIK